MFKCLICKKRMKEEPNPDKFPLTTIAVCDKCWDHGSPKRNRLLNSLLGGYVPPGSIYCKFIKNGQYELARVFVQTFLEENGV